MTLSTSQNRVQYTGNGVTTAFSFPYLFYAQTDLEVYLDDDIQVSGFTITGAENPAGGSVTFSVAPASSVIVTILRKVDLSQETDFENFDGNPADVTEKQFDLCVMMSQQLSDEVQRSLVFPPTLSGSLVGELPQPVDNKTLVWDGTTGLVKNGPDAIDVSSAVADAEAAQAAAEAAQAAAELAQAGAETAEDNAVAAAGSASIGNLFLLTTGTIATDDYIAFSDTSASNVGKKTTLANVDAGFFGSGSATDNYVLTADGAGGAAWEAASGALPDQTGNSGRYLSTNGSIPIWAPVSSTSTIPNNGYALNRYNFGLATAATSGAAVTANRLYAIPYIVGATTTFTRIGINVTSATAGNARLGIYNFADGVPTTLVLDCGTVSTGSTGDKEVTISQSLTAGIYVLAVVFDATPSVAAASERNFINYLVGDVSSTGNNVFQYVGHTYGALPTPFGTATYTGTASPSLWLRKV